MKHLNKILCLGSIAALAVGASAQVRVYEGAGVHLKLAQNLSSKTAKEGDTVMFKVAKDVYASGKLVLRAGTPVTAVIEDIESRGRYGKNAAIDLEFNPVKAVDGTYIELQDREAGAMYKGSRTDHAAAATAGGALVLGPVGLLGGYFVVGKPLNLKAGDVLHTQVAETKVVG